ncbi:MAG: glutamine--tRNA ligase [Verrucomicrobia bacterium]|nr:MAG: glutamine--tRNA ligase [Verrucomicrobiota bacterium]
MSDAESTKTSQNFIRQIVAADVEAGRHSTIVTRFPPEPNGYLHLGSAKAFSINFGIAEEFNGRCHLRMDDTNPEKEETEYVESIIEDIRWMGYDWGDHLYFASDYFGRLHELAVKLIEDGKAYVCDLDQESWKDYRGVPSRPGKESPYRARSVGENLDLFTRMKVGEFEEGSHVLRAKIDMTSPNIHLRDPALYRVKKVHHHRTGDDWCIYPMYDYAHALSDAIEGITHSLCSIEFEVHRPLYDWCIENTGVFESHQYEFARLNVTYLVTGKRYLRELVHGNHVSGWDDPRMPTIRGMRRRGYTPAAIRSFLEEVGVTKFNSLTDFALLEHHVRQDLNETTNRVMGVLDPVRLVIENYPEGQEEELPAANHPSKPEAGDRKIPFSGELYIEREDFMEDAPNKFRRLTVGREVRLRYGFFVTCTGFSKDPDTKEITEVRCTYDPATRGGDSPDGRKVKGTIHWVSANHALDAEVRLYDRLFAKENIMDGSDGIPWIEHLNKDSLATVRAKVEPSLAEATPGTVFQFERKGYFSVDTSDSRPGNPVFNRTVTLRDTWGRKRG